MLDLPRDVVLALPFDADLHITWLIAQVMDHWADSIGKEAFLRNHLEALLLNGIEAGKKVGQ